MRFLAPLLVPVVISVPPVAAAQDVGAPSTPPAAAPADVASLDAILGALYAVISGPAGPRDWDRFRALFAPGARLIPTVRGQDQTARLRVWSPEEYAEQASRWFSENSFYEEEISRTVETYGQLVHAFSTYVSRRAPDDEPFVRGINSIQLLDDGTRWWIVSIMWADERAAGSIPDRYLDHGREHHDPGH